MKKLLFFSTIVLLFLSTDVFAQGKYGADSANCVQYLSYYREYFKQKQYDDAYPNWVKAYEVCPPTATENLLINGATLVVRQIGKTTDTAEREALVETLLKLQDQRAEYYPNSTVKALTNKATYIANYLQNDPEKAHKFFTMVIDALGENVGGLAIEGNFRSVIKLFEQGKVDAEYVIDLYTKSMDKLENVKTATEAEKEKLQASKSTVQGLFLNSNVASCEQLQILFTPRLEANPQDLALIKTIVVMLNTAEDCTGNDLYFRAVTEMDKLEPSDGSAYALYRMNYAKGNTDAAIEYLESAYEKAEDAAKKSDYAIELASLAVSNGQKGKALEFANKVLALEDKNAGKAYLVIGNLWASATCASEEAKTLRYSCMVAVDYFNRAKNADSSLAEQANSLIGRYSAYFPAAADAFMYGVNAGQTVTVSCGGMTATTTVRTH